MNELWYRNSIENFLGNTFPQEFNNNCYFYRRSKVLDLMSLFLSFETLDVESLTETQSLFSQIWHLSRTGSYSFDSSYLFNCDF